MKITGCSASSSTGGGGTVRNQSTGIYTGGTLSIGTPNTTFSISDGTGVVVDNTTGTPTATDVSWTGKTNITATYVASGLVSYVALDSAGTVVQQLTPFTNSQHRDLIVIGSLIHVNLTNLDAVNQFGEVAISPANQLSDLSEAIGKFNVNGNAFSANGANLQLNKSSGNLHAQGSNWANNPDDPNVIVLGSLTALTFQYRFQNGSNGATGTNINPNIYDNAGVSTAVPSNKFTVQRIYCFVSNNVKIQPGQTLYNSLAEAKAAIQTQSFVTETSISANGVLRGFLVVQEGTTDLTSPTKAFFLEAPKFGGTAGVGGLSVSTLQNAYDNSTTPEIVTDATRGAVDFKRGSAADTDNVVVVQNGAGAVKFAVTGEGVVTGTSYNGVILSSSNGDKTYLKGDGTYGYVNPDWNARQTKHLIYADSFDGSSTGLDGWVATSSGGGASYSGSILNAVAGNTRFGLVRCTSGGSSNTGFSFSTVNAPLSTNNPVAARVVFRTESASDASRVIRFGFGVQWNAVDTSNQLAIEVDNTTLVGRARTSGGTATTSTSFTVVHSTWYIAELSATGTAWSNAVFKLYNGDTGALLWQSSLTVSGFSGSHHGVTLSMHGGADTSVRDLITVDSLSAETTLTRPVVG